MDSFLSHQMLMLHGGFLCISGVGRSSLLAKLSEMSSKVRGQSFGNLEERPQC